jgi:hypothetical protein
VLTEALCARNSCHNACSARASSNRARGTPGATQPLLQLRCGGVRC